MARKVDRFIASEFASDAYRSHSPSKPARIHRNRNPDTLSKGIRALTDRGWNAASYPAIGLDDGFRQILGAVPKH